MRQFVKTTVSCFRQGKLTEEERQAVLDLLETTLLMEFYAHLNEADGVKGSEAFAANVVKVFLEDRATESKHE